MAELGFDLGGFVAATGTAATTTSSPNWWESNTWGGGSGRMAIRGAIASALKLASLQQSLGIFNARAAQAMQVFEQQTPGSVGQQVVFEPPDPRAQKIVQAIQAVQQLLQTAKNQRIEKKLEKRQAHLEAKLELRQMRDAARADVRVTNLYGPNAGYYELYGAPRPVGLVAQGGEAG